MSFHEEEVLGKAYDARLMRRLLAYLRPHKWYVLGALLALIAAGMILFGARPPSNRPGATATSGLAPAAG